MSAHQEIFFMPTQAFVSIIGIRDPEKSKGKDLSSRKLITRSLIQKITAWERSVVGCKKREES